jgi:hypothetical protein
MNKPAFVELLRVLRNVKPEQFDMSNWTCGTTACAIGHAFSDPWFVERGAYIKQGAYYTWPVYNGWKAFPAVSVFFNIDGPKAMELFGIDGTLDEVIARIEKELANE